MVFKIQLNLVLGFLLLMGSAGIVLADEDDGPGEKRESLALTQPVSADLDEDDLSLGISEPINIEQAWVENSLFLFVSADNDFSKGNALSLEGQWEFAFDPRWGMELEFPQVLAIEPLGQGPAALGPIGLHLRHVVYQFGDGKSSSAGIFSLQAGGADWATPDRRFPGVASSLTAEALAAFRQGRIFLQGDYGYSVNLDQNAFSGWTANTALGLSLGSQWVAQVEGDFSSNAVLDADDGISGNQWVFTPQIGFETGKWFLELGESLNGSGAGTTVLMIESDI